VLPSRPWKRGQFGLPWYPGETVITGIGQGFNVVTPVQLAVALSALVNGGTRFEPRLLFASKTAGAEQAQRVIAPVAAQIPMRDPANWDVVHEGMRLVIHGAEGTARAIMPESGLQIAGKSGTAQVATQAETTDRQTADTAEHLRHHALFIAYAPFENPGIVVAAVVEHGGGGSSQAAPAVRAVIDAWLSQEMLP
jgi:penicillin-binding protein 2